MNFDDFVKKTTVIWWQFATIVAILFMVWVLTGCNPFAVDVHPVYIIEEGQHFANKTEKKISPVLNERVEFAALFNISHIYDNGEDDINKLYGITSTKIHNYSARIGWRWNVDKVEIFAYYYIDGVRSFVKLGDAQLNTRHEFIVDVTGKYYYFNFDGNELRVKSGKNIAAFRSFPYFGGNNSAPNRMTFTIVEL